MTFHPIFRRWHKSKDSLVFFLKNASFWHLYKKKIFPRFDSGICDLEPREQTTRPSVIWMNESALYSCSWSKYAPGWSASWKRTKIKKILAEINQSRVNFVRQNCCMILFIFCCCFVYTYITPLLCVCLFHATDNWLHFSRWYILYVYLFTAAALCNLYHCCFVFACCFMPLIIFFIFHADIYSKYVYLFPSCCCSVYAKITSLLYVYLFVATYHIPFFTLLYTLSVFIYFWLLLYVYLYHTGIK